MSLLFNTVSDHMPIFLSVKCRPHQTKGNNVMMQSITPNSLEMFSFDLSFTDWQSVYGSQEPDTAYEIFLDKFCALYEKHFPPCPIRNHSSKIRKQWITQQLYVKIKHKQALYKKFFENTRQGRFYYIQAIS